MMLSACLLQATTAADTKADLYKKRCQLRDEFQDTLNKALSRLEAEILRGNAQGLDAMSKAAETHRGIPKATFNTLLKIAYDGPANAARAKADAAYAEASAKCVKLDEKSQVIKKAYEAVSPTKADLYEKYSQLHDELKDARNKAVDTFNADFARTENAYLDAKKTTAARYQPRADECYRQAKAKNLESKALHAEGNYEKARDARAKYVKLMNDGKTIMAEYSAALDIAYASIKAALAKSKAAYNVAEARCDKLQKQYDAADAAYKA